MTRTAYRKIAFLFIALAMLLTFALLLYSQQDDTTDSINAATSTYTVPPGTITRTPTHTMPPLPTWTRTPTTAPTVTRTPTRTPTRTITLTRTPCQPGQKCP